MFLAMEYMPLGDLEQNVQEIENSPTHTGPPLSEEEVQEISRQILEGLKIMHAEGFARNALHRWIPSSLVYTPFLSRNYLSLHCTDQHRNQLRLRLVHQRQAPLTTNYYPCHKIICRRGLNRIKVDCGP